MAVKYFCPKCGRRFIEWGAQKLDFKCPTDKCDEEKLILLGAQELESAEGPKLKRVKKSKAPLPVSASDLELSEMDEDYIGDDVEMDEESEVEEEEEADVLVVDDDEVAVLDDDIIVDDDAADADDDGFVDALDIDSDEIIVDEE